jgi:hypothetical protein
MSRPRTDRQADRNQEVYRRCAAGEGYGVLAAELAISDARVEQIFKAEAKRQHPQIYAMVVGGRGFRARFLELLKAQGAVL